MARTIEEIKREMTDAFMRNATLAKAYGFGDGAKFSEVFSKVSLESVLMYIVASSIWVLEKLFDTHKKEVSEMILQMKPHSLRWYVDRAKQYRHGMSLLPDSDEYGDKDEDGKELTDEAIAAMQIVKYASACENETKVELKIAKEDGGELKPLDEEEFKGFCYYLSEIKDAGVTIEVINERAYLLQLKIEVYYNPMVLNGKGESFATGQEPVKEKIKEFIKNLPFNSEYRNQSLLNSLQEVEGVEIVKLINAQEKSPSASEWNTISVNRVPYSGYYKYDEESTITYIAYENYKVYGV